MEFKDIKTWLVDADHKARPKNPYEKHSPQFEANADHPYFKTLNSNYNAFDLFAKEHTYATDETLPPGKYPAEMFAEPVWQFRGILDDDWCNENANAYKNHQTFDSYAEYARSLNGECETRQYLPLNIPTVNLIDPKAGEVKWLKEYVFALYWGQKAAFAKYAITLKDTVIVTDGAIFTESHRWILHLRPLSSITDNEAIEVAKFILGGSGVRSTIKQGKTLINHIFNNGDWEHEWFQIDPSDVIQVYQYLQQQGFALPTYYKGKLYPIEELESLNIIKVR